MEINHQTTKVYKTNLFPIRVDFSKTHRSVLKTFLTERGNERKILNRLRYRLAQKLKKPVYYFFKPSGEAYFIVLAKVDGEITIDLEGVSYDLFPSEELKEIPKPTAQDVEYIIKDLLRFSGIESKLVKKFKKEITDRRHGKVIVFPQLELQVWKHFEEYLLQLDIRFRIVPEKNLQQLLEENLLKPEDIVNNPDFKVKPAEINKTFQILEVKKASEYSEEHLQTIAKRSTREITKKVWKKVLNSDRSRFFIATLKGGYVYPAVMLRPVLNFANIENTKEVSDIVKLPPEERFLKISFLVKIINKLTTSYGIEVLSKPLELTDKDKIPYLNEVKDAKGLTQKVKGLSLKPFLERCHPFIKRNTLKVQILIVEESYKDLNNQRKKLLKEIFRFLTSKGIKLEFLPALERKARETRKETKAILAPLLGKIKERKPDLVIAFIPTFGGFDIVRELSLYDYIKQTLLGENIASQIILNTTLFQEKSFPFIALNVEEQILGKTGNVPYKLARPLEGSDVFIGIDISRAANKGKSVNAGAFTKIFFADGTFLKYSIQLNPTLGEELTERAIDNVFLKLSEHNVKGRITVHRDGFFRGKEVKLFLEKAKDFGYGIELVEVIKSGNSRFFGDTKTIKGLYYLLDNDTAVVATYNNTDRWVHRPIRVRKVYGDLPIQTHISNILSLTLLNYASFRTIRLPATTHYSDEMATFLLRGIVPAKQEGEEMFWL
jgi:argonaute-like protein implicated in RNA metabolism and viral defense